METDKPVEAGAQSSEPPKEFRVLPYFVTLELDQDASFVDAYRGYLGVVGDQLGVAEKYVPARQTATEAETAHKATTKYKQQDEEVRAAEAKKKKSGKDDSNEKTKLDKMKEALAKTANTMETLYPGMTPLQCVVKTNAQLYLARQTISGLDQNMADLKKKEEDLDNVILEAVKKAYRGLSLKLHPDRLPNSTEADTQRFQELKEANAVLADTVLRRKYMQMNDHNEFVKSFRPKADANQYDNKGDQHRAKRAQEKASANAEEGEAPVFRLTGGLPHKCSQPELVETKLLNKQRGDSQFTFRWTCSDAAYLAVKHFSVTMVIHTEGSARTTSHPMGNVTNPVFTTSTLFPGMYDFSVAAVNDIGSGPPSQILRVFVTDLEAQREKEEREKEEIRVTKAMAAKNEWERALNVLESEVASGAKSLTRLEELLKQASELAETMHKSQTHTESAARIETLLSKLTESKYHKMELANWRGELQQGVKDIALGVGRPDDASSELAYHVLEWPQGSSLAPAVRNLILQTFSNLPDSLPPLRIVFDAEIQELLSIPEINSLGSDDFEKRDGGEHVYVPKWREIQPYDRAIEVLRKCTKRGDIFGKGLGKIQAVLGKLELERERRESEWKHKIVRDRKAISQKAAEALNESMNGPSKGPSKGSGTSTPVESENGGNSGDRYEVTMSNFAKQAPQKMPEPVSSDDEMEYVTVTLSKSSFSQPLVAPGPVPVAAKAPRAATRVQRPAPAPAVKQAEPKQQPRPIAPPPQKARGTVSEPFPTTTPQTLAALNEDSIAMRFQENGRQEDDKRVKQAKVSSPKADKTDRAPPGSFIYKAWKKCTRVNPDGSCVHGVKCWHASLHTFEMNGKEQAPPASPSPAAGSQMLNGLKLVIEKNLPAVSMPPPVSGAAAAAPQEAKPPVAAPTVVARRASPVDASGIAAIWDAPTPALAGNRHLPASSPQRKVTAKGPPGLQKPQPERVVREQPAAAPVSRAPAPSPSSPMTSVPDNVKDFLTGLGLGRLVKIFEDNEFDMEAVMLTTDDDLRMLKIPMGPMLKLKEGIKKLRELMESQELAPVPEPEPAPEPTLQRVKSMEQVLDAPPFQPSFMVAAPVERQTVDVPPHFICPITQEIMISPVVCPDGFTYEEDAIRSWLKANGTSPMTQQSLVRDEHGQKTKVVLTPNFTLRSYIQEFKEKYPESMYDWN